MSLYGFTMMSKLKILFFAADPLSIPPSGTTPRLLLDGEVREIRKRVHAARFGRILEFDWRLAARTKDLQHALEETHPQIVHFSGHCGSQGIVLVGADGRTPRRVNAPVLRELFQRDARRIRLVVLTACHSLPQAEAIKEVVGCAIGTRDRISDEAAITFNAKFYSAIASGRSVQDAFERARMALRLEYPSEGDVLELLRRDDVDPAKLVFVSRFRRLAPIGAGTTAAAVLAGVVATTWPDPTPPPVWEGVRLGDCAPAVATSGPARSSVAVESLEEARAQCAAGNYDSAFVLFKLAADAGNREAKGFVGIAYLSGEGTERDSARAIDLLREASYARDPRAMNTLAIAYLNGRAYGLDPNRDSGEALRWYQKAAAAGSPAGMAAMGRVFQQGIGVGRDYGQARSWLEKGACAGSAVAMNDLGELYLKGWGVEPDRGKAISLFRKGVEAGSAEAASNLKKLEAGDRPGGVRELLGLSGSSPLRGCEVPHATALLF